MRLLRTIILTVPSVVALGAWCHAPPPRAINRVAAPQPHHVQMKAHTAPVPTKLYYRPFCRRSKYVTNPAAPCWG